MAIASRPTSISIIVYGSMDSIDHAIDETIIDGGIIDDTVSSFLGNRDSKSSGVDSYSNQTDDDGAFKCWSILLFAILLEVAGTTSMKMSDQFTKIIPSVLIYIFYGLSFYAFPLSLKRIDLSTSYAVWSGLGTVLTCLIGFFYFDDTMNPTKIISLMAIIAGCVLLKFAD